MTCFPCSASYDDKVSFTLHTKQRDGDFFEVAVILGVSSVRPFNISAPSGLIIQRKLLGFRIRAKSKVHKNSDKNDHQGLRYKRF